MSHRPPLRSWLVSFGLIGAACSGTPELPAAHRADVTLGVEDCTAPSTLQATDLVDFVAALQHAYSYSPLPLDAMSALMTAVHAVDDGDIASASSALADARYQLVPLSAGGACYLLLTPPGYPGPIEQAVVIFAPAWRRNLVIEAPHAHEDHNTDAESALLFVRTGAKALVISGSHRCVQGVATSGCHLSSECSHKDPTSGRTPAIPPSESDPSHSIHNALNAVHLAFRTTPATVLQLHTNFHQELNGDALVSNGTRYVIPGTAADALYSALRTPDVNVRSCNDPKIPALNGAFCGEINTQGLASNGAADVCLGRPTNRGDAGDHRFIHLEQSNYQMCRPLELGANPLCLGSFVQWADRVGAALETAIAAER